MAIRFSVPYWDIGGGGANANLYHELPPPPLNMVTTNPVARGVIDILDH